jgi:hypothetical protein
LSAEPICAVCRTPTELPVSIDWVFRPNEFLIESLRDHSVLSLVWVLNTLVNRSRSSLYYAGPTKFAFDPEGRKTDAEADLIVVTDGIAILCEVKASWSHLRGNDVDKLVSLALRLRPDRALLAVMAEGDPMAAKLAEAKAALNAAGIEFEVMRFDPANADHDPYLRF